jgi:hypothetical protein
MAAPYIQNSLAYTERQDENTGSLLLNPGPTNPEIQQISGKFVPVYFAFHGS